LKGGKSARTKHNNKSNKLKNKSQNLHLKIAVCVLSCDLLTFHSTFFVPSCALTNLNRFLLAVVDG